MFTEKGIYSRLQLIYDESHYVSSWCYYYYYHCDKRPSFQYQIVFVKMLCYTFSTLGWEQDLNFTGIFLDDKAISLATPKKLAENWNIFVFKDTAVFFCLFTILNSRYSSQPITFVYFSNWPIASLGENKWIKNAAVSVEVCKLYYCRKMWSCGFFKERGTLRHTSFNFNK